MIYNALGVKVKGSEKTLAETLGIELPKKPITEVKLEKVYTENLKEVIVELNDASLVKGLDNVNKYRMVGNTIESAKVNGNKVVLELKDALVRNRDYKLIIRDLDKAINGEHKFKAEDKVAPAVEKVTVLGTHGIRVTTSEPIENARERNFLIDGKNVAMVVEQYGRELVLRPYYDRAFPENAKELTIKELKDYAGFKSSEQVFDIEIKKDEAKPAITKVEAKGQTVVVTFDQDVYEPSVLAYESRRQAGNISYEEGRHTIYAKEAKKVDTNKVVYTFDGNLPRRVELVDFTIEGVKNHSLVAMDKAVKNAELVIDYSEPVILKSYVTPGKYVKEGKLDKVETATYTIVFDKAIQGLEKKDGNLDIARHFKLYENEVLKRNDVSEKIVSAKITDKEKTTVKVELKDLTVNNKASNYEYNYVLEVQNFEDTTVMKNKMYVDYKDFEITNEATGFTVLKDEKTKEEVKIDVAKTYGDKEGRELTIYFNKPVNREMAEDGRNYFFVSEKGKSRHLVDLGGEAIVERDGKTVTLSIPYFNEKGEVLEILPRLEDKDGSKISGKRFYDFNAEKWLSDEKPQATKSAITYTHNKEEVKDTLVLDKTEDDGSHKVTVKYTGQSDKVQALLYRANGQLTSNGVKDIKKDGTAEFTINTKEADYKNSPFKIEVKDGDKIISTLKIEILDTDVTGIVKFGKENFKIELGDNKDEDNKVILPGVLNLAELSESDFKVNPNSDKANGKVELAGNNRQLIVTITAENGKVEVYNMELVEPTISTMKAQEEEGRAEVALKSDGYVAVYEDGKLVGQGGMSDDKTALINLTKAGVYEVRVTEEDANGKLLEVIKLTVEK